MAVRRDAHPIDALEKKGLSETLKREFGSKAIDFTIIEARILDYRSKADAILVSTSFTLNSVPMRQMHIFTCGSFNSVLISYTDLRDPFEAKAALDKVRALMMSVELREATPKHYDGLMYSLSGMACMGSAAFLGKLLRRCESKANLSAEEDSLFEDDEDFEVEKRITPEAWQLVETRYGVPIA